MTGPIVIAAGGTGGHFFPAEALAAELLARGRTIALMTDARSGGLKSPVFASGQTFVLSGAGIAGRGVLRGGRALAALAAGTWQARGLFRQLDPVGVVGFGGYPSVAPVLAARAGGRRPFVLLHEQNAVLGRANRILSRFADVLALGFAGTRRLPDNVPTAVVGNPVRPAIRALSGHAYAPPTDRLNLLVVGGSLGARVFSDLVPGAIAALPESCRRRLSIAQQCRDEDLVRVRAAYAAIGLSPDVRRFFDDVPARLMDAHLVIARAGASTVAELTVAGRPSILVPLPGAIDDHQTANAAALARAQGAVVLAQAGLTSETLSFSLQGLLTNPSALADMAAAAASCARLDAASALADLVEARVPA